MSGDEITPNDAAIELSAEDLDEVVGGLNLRLTAALFQETNTSFTQKTNLGPQLGSTETAFATQNITSAALQITITDATAEDLQVLGGLLGDATAIEGSP